MGPDPASALAALHRALGLPADYAATRGLALQPEAGESDLIVIGHTADGRELRLTAPAAAAWEKLHRAAAGDGIELVAVSGFRSISRQTEIVRTQLAAGRPLADLLHFVAAPGFSEHHTGCALDLATPGSPPLEESFADTAAFVWLARRAGEFGFTLSFPRGNPHGIAFEPWHWRWRP